MGYATTVLRLRDADRETEILCEALDGDSDEEAVVELAVILGYGSSCASRHEGYVRLNRRHFDALAEWFYNHADSLRNKQWAEESSAAMQETQEEDE